MSEFQIPPSSNPKDFELLVCDVLNEAYNTSSFKCFGKNGHKQKGIDILSSEKDVVAQCKLKDLTRKHILIKRELFNDIEETIDLIINHKPKINFNLLYIATTFSEHPDFDEYCEILKTEKKLDFDIIFWGWQTIQKKISGSPKIIAAHYPTFVVTNQPKEHRVTSKLEMKRKIEKDFGDWINYSVENRKRRSRMIIHSVDDTKYPEHELNKEGKYQWFAAEIKSRTHKGVEFFTGLEYIYIDKDLNWTDFLPKNYKDFTQLKVFKVSVIAYEDIIDYDLRGDEHYICPHFFCKFRHNGSPYCEEYYYQKDNKEFPYYFEKPH